MERPSQTIMLYWITGMCMDG